MFARRPSAPAVRMASYGSSEVRVRGNGGNRVAAGTEHRLRDTLILITLVASPSLGILLLGLAR